MKFLFLALLLTSTAQAKVFDFKNPSYGAFVGGTYGPSLANDSAYAGSSGSGVSFDQAEKINYSGEFGFLASTSKFNLKVYAEYLFPKHLTTVNGSNSSGVNVYTLDTQVSAIIPTVAVEIPIKTGNTWRWLAGAGYGYALGNLANKYSFTTTGATQFGLSNFEEDATAKSSEYLAYTSFEFQFTDIATMMFSAGYRYLRLNTWNSTSSVTGFNGTESSGSTLTNADGSNRTVNLSGPYAGVSLRFYFF